MFTIKQCVLILLLITVCSKARNGPEGGSRQLEEVATRQELDPSTSNSPSSHPTDLPSNIPTESPTDLSIVGTDIEFDGMMFDISFEPRIMEAIQRREHPEAFIPGQELSESFERRQLGVCIDIDYVGKDKYGEGCAFYNEYPKYCSYYDTNDFRADDVCCACGGGMNAASCPEVEVLGTNHPYTGANGQYFLFDHNQWSSIVGAGSYSEWHGTNWYVEKSGSNSWKGMVRVWYSNDIGGHGRRQPYDSAGPGQWAQGDSITLPSFPCYGGEDGGKDSCIGNCGGKAETCWCDDWCTTFGDCCSDYQTHCTRRELGEEENTEINGRRNLAEAKNKQGSAQRLLKML